MFTKVLSWLDGDVDRGVYPWLWRYPMLQRFLPILVMYLALKCLGCACSSVGYPSGARIDVIRSAWSSKPITVQVEMDRIQVRCTNFMPGANNYTCDNDYVKISHNPEVDCTACAPAQVPGLYISISDTPACITISITESGMLLGKTTFEPPYTISQPEGPGCGEFHYWKGTWELP